MYVKSYIHNLAVFISTCKAPDLISDILTMVCQIAWQLYTFKHAMLGADKICMGDDCGGSDCSTSCWDKEKNEALSPSLGFHRVSSLLISAPVLQLLKSGHHRGMPAFV